MLWNILLNILTLFTKIMIKVEKQETVNIYEPREDSFLLKKHIKTYASGDVLDIGTGSGILAVEAAQCQAVKNVLAVDIQEAVVEHCKKTIHDSKIKFQQSNLFSTIPKTKRFDCILFNPPYLPAERHLSNTLSNINSDITLSDINLDGGKKGYEIIEQFLDNVCPYLKNDGRVLLLFSSLTNKNKIDSIIENNSFFSVEIDSMQLAFERLYLYLIEKSSLLKELNKHKIISVKRLAKGKRGIVFKGNYKGKEVIIKAKNPKSRASSTIIFEANWLKRLNKYNIGPKLYLTTKEFLVMEYIDGQLFAEYIKQNPKNKIIIVIKNIFEQLYILDQLGINKQEMSHPQKHIIIKNIIRDNAKNIIAPVLIDFERCRATQKPRNVTQFIQYLTSKNILVLLNKMNIKINKEIIQNAAKVYKTEKTKENYNKIILLIQ